MKEEGSEPEELRTLAGAAEFLPTRGLHHGDGVALQLVSEHGRQQDLVLGGGPQVAQHVAAAAPVQQNLEKTHTQITVDRLFKVFPLILRCNNSEPRFLPLVTLRLGHYSVATLLILQTLQQP